ncbi:formyl peptide receptor 2-like [Corythoichthys intestinalis]|uniref:formyl peptide receptor 2-like n=1 Tax=Corythoichthys intestinalis TaxID=161448 RepID=UPI0025A55C25|nr:formyl peptide receptor 2-like [Corythoichthys intestinalis]XP_057684245.1 formyl peptide receptor 2-like [Corythoichthys intestinalis]
MNATVTNVIDECEMDLVALVLNTLNILLGIPGNCIVIWVAGFKLKASVFNMWLINLAVADLTFCFTRIFSLIKVLLSDQWLFGPFMCKLSGFFKYSNMFCAVFMLAVISLDRAMCIWFPVFSRNYRTLRASRVVVVSTWGLVMLVSVPFFVYRRFCHCPQNLDRCGSGDVLDEQIRTALYLIRFLCGFLLPFLVILVCYTLAGVGLLRTRLPGKSRNLRVLALLVSAFFLCWAPYHILLLIRMVNSDSQWVIKLLPAAKGLAFFKTCLNPILYFFIGLKMNGRKSLTDLYKSALTDDIDQEVGQLKMSSREPVTDLIRERSS